MLIFNAFSNKKNWKLHEIFRNSKCEEEKNYINLSRTGVTFVSVQQNRFAVNC